MSDLIDELDCPALKRMIDFGYCQELQMAVDGAIVWDGMEDRFDEHQTNICKNCIKRIDPTKN